MLDNIVAKSVEELFEKVIEQEERILRIEKHLGLIQEDISS